MAELGDGLAAVAQVEEEVERRVQEQAHVPRLAHAPFSQRLY